MTYPNITDKEIRQVLAKTLWGWHHEVGLCVKWDPVRALIKDWIYGFRRALGIIGY